jgi:hypothetical protein
LPCGAWYKNEGEYGCGHMYKKEGKYHALGAFYEKKNSDKTLEERE